MRLAWCTPVSAQCRPRLGPHILPQWQSDCGSTVLVATKDDWTGRSFDRSMPPGLLAKLRPNRPAARRTIEHSICYTGGSKNVARCFSQACSGRQTSSPVPYGAALRLVTAVTAAWATGLSSSAVWPERALSVIPRATDAIIPATAPGAILALAGHGAN